MTLEQLQLDIAGRLDSLPAFQYVKVTAIRPRSEEEALQIKTALDNALAGLEAKNGKSGACAIVQMPVLDVENPDVPGPEFNLSTIVRILENPFINMGASGTQLSAETIGLAAIAGLHHWDPGLGKPLFAQGRAMEPVPEFIDDGKIVYDINLTTRLGIMEEAYVPAPDIQIYNNTAGMACCLEGAEIRYTTDGSFPAPDATLYESPVDVTGVETVRAVAYKDALNPSSITQADNPDF